MTLKVYDRMGFTSVPDRVRRMFYPMTELGPGQLWPAGADRSEPDIDYLRGILTGEYDPDGVRPSPFYPLMLDIEHWPLWTNQLDMQTSLRKYEEVIATVRRYRPELQISLSGIVPRSNVTWGPDKSEHLSQWQRGNEQLWPLARQVDFITPFCYPTTDLPTYDAWAYCMGNKIAAAKAYGLPVYPCVCPRIHANDDSVTAAAWSNMLCFIRDVDVDGIVIAAWGWSDLRKAQYDWGNTNMDQDPCWLVLRDFIRNTWK